MKDPALSFLNLFYSFVYAYFFAPLCFQRYHFLLGWKVKISVWGSSLNFKETTSYGPLSISESKDHWFQFFGKKAGEKKNPHWFPFFQKPQRMDGFPERIGKRRKVCLVSSLTFRFVEQIIDGFHERFSKK
jgi:hypothetical protein